MYFFYNNIFYFIRLKEISSEEVPTFYQTPKGVHDTKV